MKTLLRVHGTFQGADSKPWGQKTGSPPKAKLSAFSSAQENPAKLSDQQEVVSQGQNPYPIYASVNVHANISGEDFAGAWVWTQRKETGRGW